MAKILLVEDDDNLREIYEARLMAEGYDIVTARNGEDALVVAKENKPDLIISDVMMPNISGFDMLDILRNTQGLHDAKVIMLTALSQEDDKIRAEKLGADRYLVKSQVTLEDIVNTAAELLGAAQPVVETPPSPATEPAVAVAPTPELTLGVPVDTTSAPVAPATADPVAAQIAQPAVMAPVAPAQQPVTANPVQPAPQSEPVQIQTPTVAQQPPTTTTPVPVAENTPAATQPVAATVATTQPEPAQQVAPPQLDQPVVAAAPDSVVVEPPEYVAQPSPAQPEPTAIAVAPAPQIPVDEQPALISMPSQEPVEVAQEPVPPTVITPSNAISPAPVAPSVETVSPSQPPTHELVAEAPIVTATTPEQLDPSNIQTASSESAAVQQQIDEFVNTAPIATPEFNPQEFQATNEQGEAETIPEPAQPLPQIEQPATTTVSSEPTPPAEPVSPEAQPITSPEPTPPEPPVALALVQEVPASQPPELPVVPQNIHAATGGNKVIQPLSNDPAKTGPSLDELLAMEEAQSPAPAAPIIGGQSGPVAAQQIQNTPVQPAPAQSSQQATVFDPDDPSSVAL